MKYKNIEKGIFLSRPNRFIAIVAINGRDTVCHVKNTGRCKELLVPGATVYLEKSDNLERKTAYDVVAVEKGKNLINIDSQAPNKVFGEFARAFDPLAEDVISEVTFGDSRLDFCLKEKDTLHFVEVKGVTLENNGHTLFPDAPTERGIKHIHELEKAVLLGYKATIFFVIQLEDVIDFSPNDITHKAFGDALRGAYAKGVNIRAFSCKVGPDSMEVSRKIPVIL